VKLCAACKTKAAVLKQGDVAVCVECSVERPIIPMAKWDTVMTPTYILALERRVEALDARVESLEQTITDWTAEK
jgi:hypothetical protein